MLAVMLTAVLSRMGESARDDEHPVCISAEGSAFYGESLLRERLARYMKDCAGDRLGLRYRFVRIENATILGAAIEPLCRFIPE
jgi:hypothetical protein